MPNQNIPRLALTLITLISICVMLGAHIFIRDSSYAAGAVQQPRGRLIKQLPISGNHPLVITEMKVNGRPVSFGEKFDADDDWLKNLVISVENRSDKRILFASIQLQFPRPPGFHEKISLSDIPYGNREIEIRPPTQAERLVGIAPGQTVNMQLTSERFNGAREMLVATGYGSSIDNVHLRVNSVIFEDDTMWKMGRILQRDPNEAGRWNVVQSDSTGVGNSTSLRSRKPRLVTSRLFGANPSVRGLYWSLHNRSIERLFSHVFSRSASPPQTVCFDYLTRSAPNAACLETLARMKRMS